MAEKTYRTQLWVRKPAERGAALITSLLALGLISLLGMALTGTGIEAVTITANDRENTEVLYVADAGIAHARGLTSTLSFEEIVDLLVVGDGVPCNGDELSTQPTDPIPTPAAGGQPFPPAGRYEVLLCQDALNRIVIVSNGFGRNGATVTVEVILNATPIPAVLVDGNLRINGNPSIMGVAGAAHSNGTLDITGNPCTEQYYSSGGSVNISGSPEGGAGCTQGAADVRPGEEPIGMPDIDPANLGSGADYTLTDTGLVLDSLGNIIGGDDWEDWDWDSGNREWKAGNDILPGTYYAQGSSINISGNPGSGNPNNPPISLTLIADGHIGISGNPRMEPALVSDGVSYSMVARLDLKISGNPSNGYEGVHYAGHQIGFVGNPTVNGQVIAANLDDFEFFGENLVALQAGFMSISGNVTITYDGGDGLDFVGAISWRECRGADFTNPCGLI